MALSRTKKAIFGSLGASALIMAGATTAYAAGIGTLNATTSGAKTTGGTYNFKYSGCSWGPSGNPAYDGYVKGTFVVTAHDAHLNGRVDGYGWTKLKQVNSNTSVSYDYCLLGRDVTLHDSIAIQACKDKLLADDCTSATANR
jgi:hypothetical protein